MEIRAGVLTVSDKGARGERRDTSGPATEELLGGIGARVVHYQVVPDEFQEIADCLRSWADEGIELIVTTGGTGLGARDVTPEATLSVVERLVPGIAEGMRVSGLKHTPMAMLSRAVAGLRGRTLIVNLPGSEKGVRENLPPILPALAHAVESLRGETGDHRAAGSAIEKPAPGDP